MHVLIFGLIVWIPLPVITLMVKNPRVRRVWSIITIATLTPFLLLGVLFLMSLLFK